MQLSGKRRAGNQQAGGRANLQSLGRAMNYLVKYPRLTIGAIVALVIATAAQLAVPQLLQRIIDTIVSGATNQGILGLPANVQAIAAERLGLDLTAAQAQLDAAPRTLVTAGLIIILFAFARGLFAFGQNFLSQALSESIAFDLRNDIFTKIQRLSFSYHDRNRTGQLMIRATDDVERLRSFIGQGLLMSLQALILLVGTLAILAWTNIRLTLVVLPVLPLALGIFMAFGIIGVGANELIQYPSWCLEKGYARFAGPRSDDAEWARRANGWIRVLYLDAWVSMVVFTLATVSFYMLGATVLYRQGLVPAGPSMIATLSEMYVPSFGSWTKLLFLLGAWAVLFKTLYVASAGHSRLTADFLSLAGFVEYPNGYTRMRMIRWLCVFFPALALVLYMMFRDPRAMVVFGGFAQAATLPVISGAAVFLRYRRTDPRLAPSLLSDMCLWFALVSITAVAGWAMRDWAMTTFFPKPPA